MRKLPRDLVLILRTEAKNQRTPPIDYVIAEDGGRMVHRPEPDIAMAELLEEVASTLEAQAAELAAVQQAHDATCQMLATTDAALSAERAAHAETKRALDEAIKAAGDQATLRGEAEGKLAASEMAGIVDGWKRRAEAAEAQRDVELVTALEQAHRESPSWRLYGLCHQAATRIAELEAEVERLAEVIEEMEYSDGDASFWRHIAKQNAEALSRTGAVKVTEAMIEAASTAIQDLMPGWLAEDGKVEDHDLARAALKAAMEAGRHE